VSLGHLLRGRWGAVSALIGINTVEQEIEEELHPAANTAKEHTPC